MSVLRNLFGSSKPAVAQAAAPAGAQDSSDRMKLEERMASRREMAHEAVKVTMQAHGILSASYRFSVVRNDRRGHHYLVLVDLSTDFLHRRDGSPGQLVALGAAIRKNAATRYGIAVAGVYWRVNEQIHGFERPPVPSPGVAGLSLRCQLAASGLAPSGGELAENKRC
jgi:hypothetical protein